MNLNLAMPSESSNNTRNVQQMQCSNDLAPEELQQVAMDHGLEIISKNECFDENYLK